MTTGESGDGGHDADLSSDIESLTWDLTRHPRTEAQEVDIAEVAKVLRYAGMAVLARCPRGRERSLARTKIEEAMMWAEAAIERDGEDGDGGTRPGGGSRGSRKDRVEVARDNIAVPVKGKGRAR